MGNISTQNCSKPDLIGVSPPIAVGEALRLEVGRMPIAQRGALYE